jgi:hypothetical protein
MTLNPNAAAMHARNTGWVLGLLLGLPERRAAAKRANEERRQAPDDRRAPAIRV